MSSISTLYSNISISIEQFKFQLNSYDNINEKLKEDIGLLDDTLQQQSLDLSDKVLHLNKFFSTEIIGFSTITLFLNDTESYGCGLIIDLDRFSSVLNRMGDHVVEIKREADMIECNVDEQLIEFNSYAASNYGSELYDSLSQQGEVRPNQKCSTNFYFKRKEALSTDILVCVSCHQEITTDSYLSRDNSCHITHITKECIDSDKAILIDFRRAKCYVYKLLRSHDELTQLISCGFHVRNIKGDKPNNSITKGFSVKSDSQSDQLQICQFVYRRKVASSKASVICSACHKPIYGSSYVTRGHSLTESLHITKNCIQCDDFSKAKCLVHKLLRNHEELMKLLACGFWTNNIIGVRPERPRDKVNVTKIARVDEAIFRVTEKDMKFLFNEEPFICEQVTQGEKCQGCSLKITKMDVVLRHREKVPREKLTGTPLISQYYHPLPNCLRNRGFTDIYLRTVLCFVVLADLDYRQKIIDDLVHCGLSIENLRYGPVCDNNDGDGISENIDKMYLSVAYCSKMNANCEGCGFNIDTNTTCLIYGEDLRQSASTKLFHIKKSCLRCHFTGPELSTMTCVNSNSIADVSEDTLKECGIVQIVTRTISRGKNVRNRGSLKAAYTPFKTTGVLTFEVDVSVNGNDLCTACHGPLEIDKYLLRVTGPVDQSERLATMHLTEKCVRDNGYLPRQLAKCELIFSVPASRVALATLEQCGFRNVACE